MRRPIALMAILLMLSAGVSATAVAATADGAPAALLVFPDVETGASVETLLTVTHVAAAGSDPVEVRLTWIGAGSCTACTLTTVQLAAGQATGLVIADDPSGGISGKDLADAWQATCPDEAGFLIAQTAGENGITGSSLVVDYTAGRTHGTPAISFSAENGADDDGLLEFDGSELSSFPQRLAARYLAPNVSDDDDPDDGDRVTLTLFSLGFQAGTPPVTECFVTGHTASGIEVVLDEPLTFGCWTRVDLESLGSELLYPALGGIEDNSDQQGWLNIECSVNGAATGGVHGTLTQLDPDQLRRGDGLPAFSQPAAFSRLLQSVGGAGPPVALILEVCDGVDNDGNGVADDGCDDDGDGFCDSNLTALGGATCENDPGDCDDSNALIFPGAIEICDGLDNDCDGVPDGGFADTDLDGIGNLCDDCPLDPENDADLDGVCGDVDNCPDTPNADQLNADADIDGDACDDCPSFAGPDPDGDDVCNDADNCPDTPNPDQGDVDGNFLGDACDGLRVYRSIPGPDALDVSPTRPVTIFFTARVDAESVAPNFLVERIDDDQGGPVAPPEVPTVTVADNGFAASLTMDSGLAGNAPYRILVTEGVLTEDGDELDEFESFFLTGTSGPQELPKVGVEAVGREEQALSGSSVAPAGDLNGDGPDDFLVGAPGASGMAGEVLVYLGDANCTGTGAAIGTGGGCTALTTPDIVFQGEEAGDQAGFSVAGDFDFNDDGKPDILIGAPQPGASCVSPTCCGGGKVYLIYFDPLDPRYVKPDPSTPAEVSLSLVGQPGGIPGVVFLGDSVGDHAGRAVAGGGGENEILIGAPNADPAGRLNAGEAYLIFNDPTLSGTVCLNRVANAMGNQVDGVIYQGAEIGDGAGFSVAFPGDVVGSEAKDLAIGAPFANPPAPTGGAPAPPVEMPPLQDGGILYIPEGGGQMSGIIEICQIGSGGPNGQGALDVPGAQLHGDQADMQLGFSVAGGGDLGTDGEADLLVGAPLYDPVSLVAPPPDGTPLTNAGLVIHTTKKLNVGIIEICQIGGGQPGVLDVPGVQWTGAAEGDQLGFAVAGPGDVNDDAYDDIVLGAPFTDNVLGGVPGSPAPPGLVQNGGTVYLIDGGLTNPNGIIEICQIGQPMGNSQGVSGQPIFGTQPEELSGSSVAGVGDVTFDGVADYAVGAPMRDAELSALVDSGSVFVIVETKPPVPGECGLEGCFVADVKTGARLDVPEGALEQPIAAPDLFEVEGILVAAKLEELEMPEPPPGTLLVGAVDLRDEGVRFSAPLATVHMPVVPSLQPLLDAVPTFEAMAITGSTWTDSGIDLQSSTNPIYPDRPALMGLIDTTRTYGVFAGDLDGDMIPDAIDPDRDGDGLLNEDDNCPDVPNADQADGDGDAVGDACDNCPEDPNQGQQDRGDDGVGDACDAVYFSTVATQLLQGFGTIVGENAYALTTAGLTGQLDSVLPGFVGLDAFAPLAGGDALFSVAATGGIDHAGGYIEIDPHDIVRYSARTGALSIELDWVEVGIGVDSVDALDLADDGSIAFSTSSVVGVNHAGGFTVLRPENAYLYDRDSAEILLLLDGQAMGLEDLDALDVLADGAVAFSTSSAVLVDGELRYPENCYIYRPGEALELGFDGRTLGLRSLDACALSVSDDQP